MSLDYINHQPLDQTVVIVSAAHRGRKLACRHAELSGAAACFSAIIAAQSVTFVAKCDTCDCPSCHKMRQMGLVPLVIRGI